jgi:hypothetical protein
VVLVKLQVKRWQCCRKVWKYLPIDEALHPRRLEPSFWLYLYRLDLLLLRCHCVRIRQVADDQLDLCCAVAHWMLDVLNSSDWIFNRAIKSISVLEWQRFYLCLHSVYNASSSQGTSINCLNLTWKTGGKK